MHLGVGPTFENPFLRWRRSQTDGKSHRRQGSTLPHNSATSWGCWDVASGHRQPFAFPQWKGQRALNRNMAADILHGLLGEEKIHIRVIDRGRRDQSKSNDKSHTVICKCYFPLRLLEAGHRFSWDKKYTRVELGVAVHT